MLMDVSEEQRESRTANFSNAIRNGDRCESGTTIECIVINFRNAIRNNEFF